MSELINGKELAKEIRAGLKQKIEMNKWTPKLGVILIR